MDKKTGVFTHYVHNPADTNSISNNKAVSIIENQSNDLWIGNWNNGGINRLNVKTGNFKHYLSQSNITSILKDADGTTWSAQKMDYSGMTVKRMSSIVGMKKIPGLILLTWFH